MLPLLAVFGACAIAITYAMTCSYEAQRHAHLESEARLAIASVEALQEANLTDAQLQSVVERLATEPDVTLLVVAGGEPLCIRASSRKEWRDVSGQPSPPEAIASTLQRVVQERAPAMQLNETEKQLQYTVPFGDNAVAMVHIDASGVASGALMSALSFGTLSLGAMAVFGIVTATVLRRRVINRIAALAAGVGESGVSGRSHLATARGEKPIESCDQPAVESTQTTPALKSDEITALSEAIQRSRARVELGVQELERLALVARNTTNAVVITDLARRITWVNEGFTRITGWKLEEVVGRVPGDFLQTKDTDPNPIREMRAALREKRPCRVEVLNRAKDGRDYWLDLEIQPVRDASGVVTGFMAIESDITAAVEARHELAVSERRQKLIVAGAELGTWDWHIPSGEVHFNERWCEMLGYHPSEIEPHVRSWERIVRWRERVVHPQNRPPLPAPRISLPSLRSPIGARRHRWLTLGGGDHTVRS